MEIEWSTSGFALEDLYEMAAIAEQGGFDFYARLIARATKPGVKNTLKHLRDEEAAHKAFFLEQLRARGGAPRGTVTPELHAGRKIDRFLHRAPGLGGIKRARRP